MFLITGPKGSGKAQILSSLSQKLGMKMCRVSNVDLSAQAYAQTEIKIKNAMFRAKVCAPCMLVINNFEVRYFYLNFLIKHTSCVIG